VPRCLALNSHGLPCHARALRDNVYCFFHEVDAQDERLAASSRGGFSTAASRRDDRYLDPDDLEGLKPAAALRLIADKILVGALDPRTAAPAIRAYAALTRLRNFDELQESIAAVIDEFGFRMLDGPPQRDPPAPPDPPDPPQTHFPADVGAGE
jgi:hypothetical protein